MFLFKLLIVSLLIFIVVSLFTALYRLNSEKGDSSKVLKALTVRIALSVLLFGLLMLGSWLGWIQPHGVQQRPAQQSPASTPVRQEITQQ